MYLLVWDIHLNSRGSMKNLTYKRLRSRIPFFWFLIFAFSWYPLFASKPYTPSQVNPISESWRWKHFPELEGKGIRFITESSEQRVWVGYNEGVLEFDGYTWKSHDASNGLAAAPVEQLLVAADDMIYATTPSGIFRYDGMVWSPFLRSETGLGFEFYSIQQLSDKSIIASSNQGIFHFLGEDQVYVYSSAVKIRNLKDHFQPFRYFELPARALNASGDFLFASDVLEQSPGHLWIALTTESETGKLIQFDYYSLGRDEILAFEVIESDGKLRLGESQRFLKAFDNRIWVINSTSNKGISIYDGHRWETIRMNDFFGSDEYMNDILQTHDGTVWISSIAKIFSFQNGEWNMYSAPEYPIPANRIILHNSLSDKMWVAGYKSKVWQFDFSTTRWITYKNLSYECEDDSGGTWFLERNDQVIEHRGGQWTAYDVSDGLMEHPVRLIFTSGGQLWAAGSHKGKASTALFRNGRWIREVHSQLSWGIDYRSVFEAKDGSLWFGGAVDADPSDGFLSGVLQLKKPLSENREWMHHVNGENGLSQSNVYGIGQDVHGNIYIGGNRLLFYDGISWQAVPNEKLQESVNTLSQSGNLLLVGSRYYGLFIYDGKKWSNYTTSSGLTGNTIISIDAPGDSSIIVATENDICLFDGISWTPDIFPESLNMDFEGGSIHHTGKNTIWLNHVPRNWKRRAYLNITGGGLEKQMQFFTTRYLVNPEPPETKIEYFLERVSRKGNSLISWTGQDYFYQTPTDKLMFSYRLDQGPWSPFSKNNQHTFTNLKSGNHELQVRARDLDLNVDSSPATVTFRVLPPIWKQGWFITAMLAIIILLGIYEYRIISKKMKLEILNRSLQEANAGLKEQGEKIRLQNLEILDQQKQILEQSNALEWKNQDLEDRNMEIRKHRDQLEEMVEKIEKLSKAKVAFFTNISHELRTPLTLIQGPVMHLQQQSDKLADREKEKLYHIISRNSNRLLKLINQLLEIRRIEHSTLALHLDKIQLSHFIKEIISLFQELAIQRDIFLDFEDQTDTEWGSLDSDKVEKVLTNLLSNAFKHTPEGGSISLTLEKLSPAECRLSSVYDQYYRITVEDTGIGIPKDKIPVIFEEYYTSDSDLIDSSSTGIGLSYVKDLVYLMEGDIRVSSEPDRGTQFQVYLPVIPTKEKEGPELTSKTGYQTARQEASLLLNVFGDNGDDLLPKDKEEDSALPKILIVEDNPDMLYFLENILDTKYKVLRAMNGIEALKLANQHEIDLIVSDVMMPEMDGLTLCQRIRSNLAINHIPIILLTAKVLDENRMTGYKKGADAYITKPFSPELLVSRVDNLLLRRQQLRENFEKNLMLTPDPENIDSPDDIFVRQLMQIIHENLGEAEFNVDKMCRLVHLSHMHFIRKVKQLTGMKPIELLKTVRMRKARELLAMNKLNINEIAYKVGFDLPNSFSRAFKKEYHITPSEFVQSIQENEGMEKEAQTFSDFSAPENDN